MKNWLTSLNGAIALSAIAWLSELWRAWLDMLFEYTGSYIQVKLDGVDTLTLTLIYTVIFGGWGYSIHAATHGSRKPLVASLALNTLVRLALPAAWFTTYCTGDCPARARILFTIANWLNLIFGLLATAALALQVRRPQSQPGIAPQA